MASGLRSGTPANRYGRASTPAGACDTLARRARRRPARRAEALAAAREAAAAAEAHGARLLVFGSLAGGPAASRFHARSDLDLAVWGEGLDDEALAEAASDAFHAAALRGFEADVVRLDRAPPALAERIRTHGRDPRDLV